MTIEYNYTKEDWMQFHLFVLKNSKSYKRNGFIYVVVIPVAFIFLAFVLPLLLKKELEPRVITTSVILILFSLSFPFRRRFLVNRNLKKTSEDNSMKLVFVSQSITLKEDGLFNKTPNDSAKTPYGLFQKIEFDGALTYLFIGSFAAYVIPDSAFNENVTKEAFISELKTRIAAAK